MVDVIIDLDDPIGTSLEVNTAVTGIVSADLFLYPIWVNMSVGIVSVEATATKRQASNLPKNISVEPQDTGEKTRYTYIDLAKEFEILKREGAFRWVGLRQPDYSKPCACALENTLGSLGPTQYCTRCLNTGYLFTDNLVQAATWESALGVELRTGPGMLSTQTKNVVVEWPHTINKFDILIELQLRADGTPDQPFRIRRYFTITDSMPLFNRTGKIAFWKGQIQERTLDDLLPNSEGTNYSYRGNRSNNEPY